MTHVLEVSGVQLELNKRKLLTGVYLKCETGKITGLLGKNGQGKSCLMKVIYGTLPCEKSVRFDHLSIVESYKRPDLLMYLPQFNFIPKSLSLRRVFEDFELEYDEFKNNFSEFSRREKTSVGNLSGGECRLIELYLIVKSNPQFIMLDEPFTHLNPLQIQKVIELLVEEKNNKGILITDHMYKDVISVCDNFYILANGETYLAKSIEDIERFGYARL